MTEMSLMAVLTLRSEWEELTAKFKMPDNNGTIHNLKWFIENGYQGNRLRRRFNDALEIANMIVEEAEKHYDNQTFNISGVCGEEVPTL